MFCVIVVNVKSVSKKPLKIWNIIDIVIIVGSVTARENKSKKDADVKEYAGEVFILLSKLIFLCRQYGSSRPISHMTWQEGADGERICEASDKRVREVVQECNAGKLINKKNQQQS